MKINKSRLKQIIKEELARPFDDNDAESIDPSIMRAARDADKRAFFSDTARDFQAVGAEMSGYRMVDHTNVATVKTATQMADPKEVLLLGVTPEHIYFKTMDDIYYRMPKPGSELEEELGDGPYKDEYDETHGEIPHARITDELVTAAIDAILRVAAKRLQAANALNTKRAATHKDHGLSINDIESAIEVPLMDALIPLAKDIHYYEKTKDD